MKYDDICKRYTEIVADYLTKGYMINVKTMRGMQSNEVAKVDVTDGKEYIRVLLENFNEYNSDRKLGEIFISYNITRIKVGRIKNSEAWTIWNNELDVIFTEDFYRIGGEKDDYFGTKEEREEQAKIHWKRMLAIRDSDYEILPESAKNIVLPFMRRQPKCKSIKVTDIERVVKDDGRYCVYAKGQRYTMNKNRRVA